MRESKFTESQIVTTLNEQYVHRHRIESQSHVLRVITNLDHLLPLTALR